MRAEEIRDRKSFRLWLDAVPKVVRREVAVAMASRCALRVLPFVANRGKLTEKQHVTLTMVVIRLKNLAKAGSRADKELAAAYAAAAADATAAGYAAAYAAYAAADAVYAYAAYAAADAATAAEVWNSIRRDAQKIELAGFEAGSGIALHREKLWSSGDDEFENAWADFRALLKSKAWADKGWPIWLEWYEPIIKGDPAFNLPRATAEALERDIALGSRDGKFNKAFWKRKPHEINAEIAEWVGQARAAEERGLVQKPQDEPSFAPVAASYYFSEVDGLISGQAADGGVDHLDFAEQTLSALVEKLSAAAERLRKTQVDAYYPSTIEKIKGKLAALRHPMPSGIVLSEFRSWEACAAHVLSPTVLSQVGDDVSGILMSAGESFDDFKACFPEIAKIEANRLALRMQNADAEAINKSIIEIRVIADSSQVVSTSAVQALQDLEPEVEALNEVIANSSDHQEVAKAIEARGKTVGQRALVARNFAGRVIKSATDHIGEGMGDGLRKSAADLTEASAKTGFALLVSSIFGPLAGIAVGVFAFKPFAKKAEEIKKQNEDDIADA